MSKEDPNWLDYISVYGGLFMTAITFFLGFLLSQLIEKRKVRRDLDLQRNYFDLYWNRLIWTLDEQINEMTEFAEKLELQNSFINIPSSMHLQPHFMYESMDKQKLVESFRVRNQEQVILNRMLFIELIKGKSSEFTEIYNSSQELNRKFGNEWNSAIQELHALVIDLYKLPKDHLLKETYIKVTNNYLAKLEGLDNLKDMMEIVIVPLTKHFNDALNSRFSEYYSGQFVSILSRLGIIAESHKDSFQSLSVVLKRMVNVLIEKRNGIVG